jgi:hypothetical protein
MENIVENTVVMVKPDAPTKFHGNVGNVVLRIGYIYPCAYMVEFPEQDTVGCFNSTELTVINKN